MLESDRKVSPRERDVPRPSLAALVYNEQAYPDDILKQVVDRCRARGLRLAGVVQHRSREAGHRCDMVLEDLATRLQVSIFAGRGRGARGCQMDEDAMLKVVSRIERELKENPELLMLNKFGKVEAEGAGMRDLIVQAISMDIPVIVAQSPRLEGVCRRIVDRTAQFMRCRWLVGPDGRRRTLAQSSDDDPACVVPVEFRGRRSRGLLSSSRNARLCEPFAA
jgi:nucleoside-triphosphatase THEP1